MSRFPLRLATTPLILATLAIASACDRDRYTGDSGSANGEVTYASYESLESALGGEVSSAQYRKWVAAKEALDRVKKLPPPVRASGVRPSEQEIDRAVQRLEQDASARQAIESAGMSVREYVLTTLALDRAMAASKGQRLVEPAAVAEAPAPPPVDTTAYPPASAPYPGPYPGAYPATPPAQAYPPGYQPAYPAEPAAPATPAEPEPPLPGTTRPSEPVYTPVPTPRRDSAVPPMPSDPARRAPAPATPPPASPPTPAPATPAPASPVPVTPVPATPTPTPVPPPATDPPSSSPQADTTATVSANSDFAP